MDVFFINLKRKTAPKAPQKFFARAAGARAPISYIYLFFTIYNLYYNIKVGPMTFPGWDGADWVLSTQRSRIRGDWILSTQRLPIHWSLRDSLGDDIVFFIPDANKISSSFSCRFFLS